MVRPCAKYARLNCYAPLQVTAKTFAVTWSGLFPYAKLGTFWAWFGDMQDKIFLPKLLRTENIRRQNAVGIFWLVSFMHLGTIFGFCWSMEDKNLYVKCRHAAKTENSEYEKRAHR